MIYLGAALSIIRFVFGMPLGTLVTTSGVVAVIFGLALQNTLWRRLLWHRANTRQSLYARRLDPD